MKLWFFRTPKKGIYGLSALQPGEADMLEMDSPRVPLPRNMVYLGERLPEGLPDIELGACVPVTLKVDTQPGADHEE